MTIKVWDYKPIITLWNAGLAAEDIIDRLSLPLRPRQVRYIGAQHGSWKLRVKGRLEGRH